MLFSTILAIELFQKKRAQIKNPFPSCVFLKILVSISLVFLFLSSSMSILTNKIEQNKKKVKRFKDSFFFLVISCNVLYSCSFVLLSFYFVLGCMLKASFFCFPCLVDIVPECLSSSHLKVHFVSLLGSKRYYQNLVSDQSSFLRFLTICNSYTYWITAQTLHQLSTLFC